MDFRKINSLIADILTKKVTQSALCQMQHNIWRRRLSSAYSIAPRRITVCRMRTNSYWKNLLAFLITEVSLTKGLHKVLEDQCLHFQTSCATIWAQLSKLTNVLNMWTILGLAGNDASDLTGNIRVVFGYIRQAGLKLKIENPFFGVRQVDLLSGTVLPDGSSPQARLSQSFFSKLSFPKPKKHCSGNRVHEILEKIFS